MKKKILSFLICLGLTITLIPCAVFAEAELLSVNSSGTEGEWEKMEVYNDSGVLTMDYINNHDGTHTRNSYFASRPVGCKFNPTGHLQYRQVWADGEAFEKGVPIYDTDNIISAEEWLCEQDGYTHMYGLVDHQEDGDYKYFSPHTGLYYSSGGFIKKVDDE
ncbi:MAG: hypothetical protein J5590_02675 [Clostridia bacterium]|nr:hypothetical protein [Clostridia bacterium]